VKSGLEHHNRDEVGEHLLFFFAHELSGLLLPTLYGTPDRTTREKKIVTKVHEDDGIEEMGKWMRMMG